MEGLVDRILSTIPRLVRNPGRAGRLLRRAFPVDVMLKDSEAYHVVGTWTFGSLRRVPVNEVFPGIDGVDVSLVRSLDRLEDVAVSLRELVTLAAIARHTGARKVLEIGTSNGNTTVNLAMNIPVESEVVTVDLPPDWDGRLATSVPESMRNSTNRKTIGAHYRESPVASRIRQVYGDSAALDWGSLGGPFDLIFIDGCHYYDYVRKDTANALQHIRRGGTIVWHDYGTIEDVSRGVDEASKSLPIVAIRSTSLAVATVPSL